MNLMQDIRSALRFQPTVLIRFENDSGDKYSAFVQKMGPPRVDLPPTVFRLDRDHDTRQFDLMDQAANAAAADGQSVIYCGNYLFNFQRIHEVIYGEAT